MADKLLPLNIPPGIYRNGTKYQSRSRWYDSQLVRFVDGTIQPLGGWRFLQKDDGTNLEPLAGKPRAAISWRTDAGDTIIAVATTQKLYAFAGGVLHDITPVGFVAGVENTAPTSGNGNYGAGSYGTGIYGEGASAASLTEADMWHLDMFGEWLAGVCTSDNKLYVWDANFATLPTVPAGSPTGSGVVVTPERFLVVLSAGGNVRKVAWPSQETTTVWTPLSTNSAGDFELTTEGRLMCGRRTKSETLLWTDADVHAMQYIGGTLVYRFTQLGEKCGVISPHAATTFDTAALWMGNRNFFMYNGTVKPIPCPVRDLVFGDFNTMQSLKVWSRTTAEHGEVTWYYPSASSNECDRYVTFNYRENHWTIGQLRRAAGFDAGAYKYPVMVAPSGEVFEHEVLLASRPAVVGEPGGFQILSEDGGELLLEEGGGVLTESLQPYLESGPIEIGDGDRLMNVQRLIPDEKSQGQVFARFYISNYPSHDETEKGPYAMGEPTSVRFKARQARIRLDENGLSDWRVGIIRLGVRESERR